MTEATIEKKATLAPVTPVEKKSTSLFTVILFMLILMLGGAIAYLYWQFDRSQSHLMSAMTKIDVRVQETNTQMLALQDSMISMQKNIEQLQQATQQQLADAAQTKEAADTYTRLEQLNQQIDQLPAPVTQAVSENHVLTPATIPAENASFWQKTWYHSMNALSKIVTVKYIGTDVAPIVAPQSKAYLYENLHAQLENAMWAVLHHQPAVYQASLGRMSLWVKRYFPQDDAATIAILKEIDALSNMATTSAT